MNPCQCRLYTPCFWHELSSETELDVVTRLREGELRPLRLQAQEGLHASAFKSLYERGEGQELVRQLNRPGFR